MHIVSDRVGVGIVTKKFCVVNIRGTQAFRLSLFIDEQTAVRKTIDH